MILHAPKNGFFFVIDRTNGKFISAKNFVDVNWATGYDENGPADRDAGRARGDRPRESIPGPYGAHNWHPMSFNPQTGLAYMPVQDVPRQPDGQQELDVQREHARRAARRRSAGTSRVFNAEPPKSQAVRPPAGLGSGAQKEAWRVEHVSPWNGGTLTTAGNLVFQGTADGRFVAYNAHDGEKLWEAPDRHRRGRGAGHLHGRRQAVRVGRGRLGRRLRHHASRHRAAGAGHRLHLRGRRQRAASRPSCIPDGRAVQGVQYDPATSRRAPTLRSNCVFCHGVPGVDRGGNIRTSATRTRSSGTSKFVFKGPVATAACPTSPASSTPRMSTRSRPSFRAPRTRSGRSDEVRPE